MSDDPFPVSQELHDKGIERLQELAFQATPLDTWLNTITYLAEMRRQASDSHLETADPWSL